MQRSFVISLVAAVLLASTSCSLGAHSSVTGSVGDSCLVATWTMQDETSNSGYSYANVPVRVHGLAGTRLTITAAGDEKETFDGSQPLVGTLADGRELEITIGGSFDYRIRGGAGKYTETGAKVELPTSATVAGQPVPNYTSFYEPGAGTYTCGSGTLTMTTSDENQTATWSKG